jgi:hypothetical protein
LLLGKKTIHRGEDKGLLHFASAAKAGSIAAVYAGLKPCSTQRGDRAIDMQAELKSCSTPRGIGYIDMQVPMKPCFILPLDRVMKLSVPQMITLQQ